MKKSKKIILITIIIIILILLVLFLSSFFVNKKEVEKDEGISFFPNIFNTIKKGITENPIVSIIDTKEDIEEGKDRVVIKRLNKISTFPISGYGVYKKEVYEEVPDVKKEDLENGEKKENNKIEPKTRFINVLRYSNKVSGNIYENEVNKFDERKFSNLTIPFAYESIWGKDSIIIRYLKNDSIITTFLGELPKNPIGFDSNHSNEVFGKFLPDNIKDISISKRGDKIFYLSNTNNGVVGSVLSQDNKRIQIFDSHFSEWLSFWPNNENITLTTKASGYVLGYSYLLDIQNNDFKKVLSGVYGLTTKMSPDEDKILYNNENLSLFVFNRSNNQALDLRIKTMPEKCIWSNDNMTIYCAVPKGNINNYIYPDDWYKGQILFNDIILKINTQNGNKIELIDPIKIDILEEIDAVNLILDQEERSLFFMNKKDSYLWGLSL